MKKGILIKIVFAIISCILVIVYINKPYYKMKSRIKKLNAFSMDNTKTIPLGWIQVQGTNIDFPIMYYFDIEDEVENPSYDLGWNFENQKKLSKRTAILSHNVLNVSSHPIITDKNHRRFEQLMSFIYYDFNKQNKYIQYTINNKDYLFKIYAVYLEKNKNLDLYNISTNRLKNYIKSAKKMSYFDFDVDVNEKDNIITLITCTRFYGDDDYSFVIEARKVRKNEKIKNYKVKKNNNYKGIEKILNGDESNE